MGPYIVLLFLILAGLGAWNIGGKLSNLNKTPKEPPKPSEFEQKMKDSVLKSQERLQQRQEELRQVRENLARIKEEKEEEKRRKKEEKQAKHK